MGLFGLGIFKQEQRKEAIPMAANRPDVRAHLPEAQEKSEAVLVSREDIYVRQGDRAVLLLKEGMTMDVEMMGKLVNCGADPAKFALLDADEATLSHFGHTNPIERREHVARAVRAIRSGKRVLAVHPEHRQLNRLMDCLVHCGFSLGRLSPLRQLNRHNLLWSLKKYRPDILVVDEEAAGDGNPLPVLKSLAAELAGVEQVVLILSPDTPLTRKQAGWEAFLNTVEELQIDVLFKPANRFNLNDLLIPAEPA